MPDYVYPSNWPLTIFDAALNEPTPAAVLEEPLAAPLEIFAATLSGGRAEFRPAIALVVGIGTSGHSATALRPGHRLQWEAGGSELHSLSTQGVPNGVRILAVGALCGPGVGQLRTWRAGGGDGSPDRLAWKAPGSSGFGPAVDPSGGGTWTLEDGGDRDRWIRVIVAAAYLADGGNGSNVRLDEVYLTGLEGGDVTSAEASAGLVETITLTLRNLSAGYSLANLTLWIDDQARDVWELSWDNVTFYAPRSEAAALAGLSVQTIAAGGTRTVYLRRTIAAGTGYDPKRRIVLHAAFDDAGGGRSRSVCRALFRIFNAAGYNVYRKLNADPRPGVDSVFAFNSSLPFSPSGTFADGSWHVGVERFNGCLGSDVSSDQGQRLKVTSAQRDVLPPADETLGVEVRQRAGGVVRVVGHYNPLRDRTQDDDGSASTADQWALWYTTNGSAPGSGSPQYTLAMVFAHGVSRFEYDLPGQVDGTNVRVLLTVRRSGTPGIGGLIPTLAPAEVAHVVATTAPVAAGGAGSAGGRPGV